MLRFSRILKAINFLKGFPNSPESLFKDNDKNIQCIKEGNKTKFIVQK